MSKRAQAFASDLWPESVVSGTTILPAVPAFGLHGDGRPSIPYPALRDR
jgi:hypothetical protein